MVMGELPEAADIKTDVLVIGGGPGGYACAFRAADLGLQVTLVNAEPKLGGVCLLRGCIPSKALLSLTELIQATRHTADRGVAFQDPKIDLDKLRAWQEDLVNSLSEGLNQLCKRRQIRLIKGKARFKSAREVRLQESELKTIQFKQAVVATGSLPISLPGVDFKEGGRIMDSTAALALQDIPKTLLVVGGGYVGLELGMVYATLGSQVTLVEMSERLMPNADSDLVQPLAHKVKDLFEAVHLNTRVADLKEQDQRVTVTLEGPENTSEAQFERVLVAIGRRPNTADMGLETIGVEQDEHHFIKVDRQRKTTAKNILAIGDAAGGLLLAHEAMGEGKVAAEVMAGEPAAFDARAIPAVVYTDPQIAWCGLTEQQAKADNRPVEVTRFPWRASGRARSMGVTEGVTKILVDPEDQGRILGIGITGHEAEALIAEGVLAIEMGAVARDLALIIHPHPTLSETLGEAAEIFLGGGTHFLPGKG